MYMMHMQEADVGTNACNSTPNMQSDENLYTIGAFIPSVAHSTSLTRGRAKCCSLWSPALVFGSPSRRQASQSRIDRRWSCDCLIGRRWNPYPVHKGRSRGVTGATRGLIVAMMTTCAPRLPRCVASTLHVRHLSALHATSQGESLGSSLYCATCPVENFQDQDSCSDHSHQDPRHCRHNQIPK